MDFLHRAYVYNLHTQRFSFPTAGPAPEHEQFVVGLATTLRGHEIDAVLDKWDLKPGNDKYVFMESMIVDPNVQKVRVIASADTQRCG